MHADITALYRNIERADLDLAGSNVRDRRSTMLLSVLSDDEHGRDDVWRHLLSLNRTLKVSDPCSTVIADYHGRSDKPSDTVH